MNALGSASAAKWCDKQVCSSGRARHRKHCHARERDSKEHDDEVFQTGQEKESKLERCSRTVLVHPHPASPIPDEEGGDSAAEDVRGVGSTRRPLPSSVWSGGGDLLIPVTSSEVCAVGGGVEQKEGNGSRTSRSG